MEDLAELCLSSNVKKYRDDSQVILRSEEKTKLRILDDHDNDGVKRQLH